MQVSLAPFNADDLSTNLVVTASILLDTVSVQQKMKIQIKALGDLTRIVVPNCVEQPSVKDNLWQETCFEVFLSSVKSRSYTEFNFSPSGDWAQYEFSSYRKQKSEPQTAQLSYPITMMPKEKWNRTLNQLSLDCQFENWHIVFGGHENLRIGISAVFKKINGDLSYWAIQHCGPKPDFHLFESFIPVLIG